MFWFVMCVWESARMWTAGILCHSHTSQYSDISGGYGVRRFVIDGTARWYTCAPPCTLCTAAALHHNAHFQSLFTALSLSVSLSVSLSLSLSLSLCSTYPCHLPPKAGNMVIFHGNITHSMGMWKYFCSRVALQLAACVCVSSCFSVGVDVSKLSWCCQICV